MRNSLFTTKNNNRSANSSSRSTLTTAKRLSFPAVWIAYGLTIAFLGFTLLVSRVTGYSIAVMVRDPVYVLDGHPIVGMQSNIGVLVWFAGACICLFCAAFLHTGSNTDNAIPDKTDTDETKTCLSLRGQASVSFLFSFGLMTLWLALDDLFLIHEYLSEGILGISELPIYLVYAAVLLSQVVRFRKYMMRGRSVPLLLGAIAFFALSVLSDLLFTGQDQFGRIFFEDGFKLLGIVSWSIYLIGHSVDALRIQH